MNDKKQRYNTIQKPYNNKYHNNNEKTRLITSYMDEQHNTILKRPISHYKETSSTTHKQDKTRTRQIKRYYFNSTK